MDQERPWERDTKPEGATLRARIKDVLRDKNRLHETVEQIICELERLEAMIENPSPQPNVVGDLDYCFDPENWEFTCSWPERDQVHGYGESLKPCQPMRVCTLLKGPEKWVADVPITWDEDGEPDETEIKWFDSEEEARAALANAEGSADA